MACLKARARLKPTNLPTRRSVPARAFRAPPRTPCRSRRRHHRHGHRACLKAESLASVPANRAVRPDKPVFRREIELSAPTSSLLGPTTSLSAQTLTFFGVKQRCQAKHRCCSVKQLSCQARHRCFTSCNDVARPGNVVFWCESAFFAALARPAGCGVAFDAGYWTPPARQACCAACCRGRQAARQP